MIDPSSASTFCVPKGSIFFTLTSTSSKNSLCKVCSIVSPFSGVPPGIAQGSSGPGRAINISSFSEEIQKRVGANKLIFGDVRGAYRHSFIIRERCFSFGFDTI